VAVLTLVCCLSAPSTAQAWGRHYGGWGYGGWGGYCGYGGWGYGGYAWGYPGWGYYGGWRGWGYGPWYGYGGWGYGYPYYASSPTMPYVYGTVVSTQPAAATSPDRATVRVQVPANAELVFNNTPMPSQGTQRTFVTPPLQSNAKGYTYSVVARWMQDGKERREERTIHVSPGGTTEVNFLTSEGTEKKTTATPPAPDTTGAAAAVPPR
jgi:uncharacterized protein (TIGR03000 family)